MYSCREQVCLEAQQCVPQACSCEQEGLDARVRKKEEAKLARLREAVDAHRASERERAYAVRYHKARPNVHAASSCDSALCSIGVSLHTAIKSSQPSTPT